MIPPVVYAGPTIGRDEILRWLPSAKVSPPVRRGDLYRDRMLRYSVFVILDGVFHEAEAVSPREVIDVLRDGATILGAASMGALRAADCWPAGMLGAGAIFRMFRAGRLCSDDEVAVAFDPGRPHLSTAALISVRYAASRAARRGDLTPEQARRVVAAALGLHYAERHWQLILREAGVADSDGSLTKRLAAYDLKRSDAILALRKIAALLVREPSRADTPRRSREPFRTSEASRERRFDPAGERDSPEWRRRLALWWRVRIGGACDPDRLWADLKASGGLAPALVQLQALEQAAHEARSRSWSAGARHRAWAGHQLARAHGFASWAVLRDALGTQAELLRDIEACRDEMALARRVRDAAFAGPLFLAPRLEYGSAPEGNASRGGHRS